MSKKTVNQHYISQFYLNNFSINKQKQIKGFDLQEDKFIKLTSIKKQASEKFYYGEDNVIENKLQLMETKQAPLIKKILERILPKRNSLEERELFQLFALTHIRNPIIVDYFSDLVHGTNNQSVYKILGKNSLEIHAKIIGFKHLDLITNFLIDLDYKVLVNKTSNSFITSDVPVVRYNKHFQHLSYNFDTIAYSIVGFKMFLPISADLCLVLFDSETYKIGNKKEKFVQLNLKKDIDQINLLQVLNCKSKLYFNENINEAYIRRLITLSRKERYTNQSKSPLQKGKNLVAERSININMDISCIKIHSNAKKITNSDSIPLRKKAVKNAIIVDLLES